MLHFTLCSALGVVAYEELLSNCCGLIKPKNTNRPGQQGQAIKGHPLYGLHASTSCSNAAGRLKGQGIPASFSKGVGECLGCTHLLVSTRWQDSLVPTCEPQKENAAAAHLYWA